MFNFFRFLYFFPLVIDLKRLRSFRFKQLETIFAVLDGSDLLRFEPHAVGNIFSDSIESAIVVALKKLHSCSSCCYSKDSLLRFVFLTPGLWIFIFILFLAMPAVYPNRLPVYVNGFSSGSSVGSVFDNSEQSPLIHRKIFQFFCCFVCNK